MAWSCETTAVPAIKWLGVHPSEFQDLGDDSLMALSNADRAKLR